MAKDRYYNVAGFVQFDPETRDYNGSELTDVVIKNVSKQTLVRVTIWPEFDVESVLGRSVQKGDFIAADGKFTTSEHNGKTYYNVSASALAVAAGVPKSDRDVVNDDADDEDDEDVPF